MSGAVPPPPPPVAPQVQAVPPPPPVVVKLPAVPSALLDLPVRVPVVVQVQPLDAALLETKTALPPLPVLTGNTVPRLPLPQGLIDLPVSVPPPGGGAPVLTTLRVPLALLPELGAGSKLDLTTLSMQGGGLALRLTAVNGTPLPSGLQAALAQAGGQPASQGLAGGQPVPQGVAQPPGAPVAQGVNTPAVRVEPGRLLDAVVIRPNTIANPAPSLPGGKAFAPGDFAVGARLAVRLTPAPTAGAASSPPSAPTIPAAPTTPQIVATPGTPAQPVVRPGLAKPGPQQLVSDDSPRSIPAQVVSTNRGPLLLETPLGTLAVRDGPALPRGEAVQVHVVRVTPPPAAATQTNVPPAPPVPSLEFLSAPFGSARGTTTPLSVPATTGGTAQTPQALGWAALDDAVGALDRSDPQAARTLAAAIPRDGPRMVASMLTFMAATARQDVRALVPDGVLRALDRASGRGPEAAKRLRDDIRELGQPLRDAGDGNWRPQILPFHDGQAIQRVVMITRRENQDDDEDDAGRNKGGGTQRFLIDLDLSRLGPLQLEGLVREGERHMDLLVRTPGPLPAPIPEDLKEIFVNGMQAIGYAGTMRFVMEPPMDPLAEAATAHANALTAGLMV